MYALPWVMVCSLPVGHDVCITLGGGVLIVGHDVCIALGCMLVMMYACVGYDVCICSY